MCLPIRIPILLLISLLVAQCAPARAQSLPPGGRGPELRAFWVDGFNDGFMTPVQCDLLLARVRAAHMNAVFIQVRKRSDAYYGSHYEPWATDDPQHFDALEYVCRKAHAPGLLRIQVHAWVNACAVGGNKGPQRLVRLHPDWLSLSDTGNDYDGESSKIDPGNPAAADWTYRVYQDIVRHYDIDGLHLDFIRYGGSDKTAGHWGYNPVSVARYNARYGTTGLPLWDDPRWMQWRRDQVTALVRRVSVTAHALKPHLIVSAATICWGDGPKDDAEYEARSAAYTQVFAPWRDWLRDGLLDLNCPMTYFDLERHPNYWQHWSDFVKDHQYQRRSVLGIGTWINTVPDSLAEIASTRRSTGLGNAAAGVALFSYAGTNSVNHKEELYNPDFYDSLPAVFPSDVPPPVMSWRDRPATGAVMGTLLRGDTLLPLDGRPVTLKPVHARRRAAPVQGVLRTVVTDGNGYFAATGLPPGHYLADVSVTDRDAVFTPVDVKVGKTTVVDCALTPENNFAARQQVAGLGRLSEGHEVRLLEAVVTNGSDRLGDNFYVADDFGKPVVRVHAPGLEPPTVAGDLLAITGKLRHTAGGSVIEARAVRQLGARVVP